MLAIRFTVVLVVFLSNVCLLHSKCDHVERRVNQFFEDKEILFFDENHNLIKRIDVVKHNPYNSLLLPVVALDSVYQMNIYGRSQNKGLNSKMYSKLFPGESHLYDIIESVNSQGDIEILDDCTVQLTYGIYGFDENGEQVAFSTSSYIYDSQGKLKHEILNTSRGDLFLTVSQHHEFAFSVGEKLFQDTIKSVLKVYNLQNKEVVAELPAKVDAYWSFGKISGADVIAAALTTYDRRGKRVSVDYYIFDIESQKTYLGTVDEYLGWSDDLYKDRIVLYDAGKPARTILFDEEFKVIDLLK